MSNDLISRQAALKWCKPEDWGTPDERWRPESEYGAMLNALPSAQPGRKTGRWIVVKRHEHYPSGKPYEQLQCPFCKRFDNNGDGSFCGYCGAEMNG